MVVYVSRYSNNFHTPNIYIRCVGRSSKKNGFFSIKILIKIEIKIWIVWCVAVKKKVGVVQKFVHFSLTISLLWRVKIIFYSACFIYLTLIIVSNWYFRRPVLCCMMWPCAYRSCKNNLWLSRKRKLFLFLLYCVRKVFRLQNVRYRYYIPSVLWFSHLHLTFLFFIFF